MILAGGGIRGGQVVGQSDRIGAYPSHQPITPADIHATVFTALEMFCVPLLLTLGLLSLCTGLLLGFGTRFGVLRYWWVVVKLLGTLVLISLVPVALRPTLIEGAAQATVVDAGLADRLVDVRRNMIFPPIVSTSTLVFLTWLAVYKPWGPTARGRRFLKVPARTAASGTRDRGPEAQGKQG